MKRCELIADIGSNWYTLEDCLLGVHVAKECGADVVKFQLYTHKDLYGYDDGTRLPKELPREWIPALKDKADKMGIEFMCTPFSPDGVRFLDPYVSRWKVASSNACDYMLLEAIKQTDKSAIMSVGAKHESEVFEAVNFMSGLIAASTLTVLYCVADYATAEKGIDLLQISRLRALFAGYGPSLQFGFSDHSSNPYFAIDAAYCYGANVIEKHLNPDPSRIQDTPDARHSLNPSDFYGLAQRLKDPLPDELQPTRGEVEMERLHNVRMIASRDISAGEEMVFSVNVAIARSKIPSFDQINPFRWPVTRIERAAADIKRGTPLTEKMLIAGTGAT